MKIPVFLSQPTPHLRVQEEFIKNFRETLRTFGLEPLTLGVSSYDMESPLSGIRRLMSVSCGLVCIALRRTHIPKLERFYDSELGQQRQREQNVYLTSPFCQIEPAMAFQLGLPILLFREEGVVAEGILQLGISGLYLPVIDLQKQPIDLNRDEFSQIIHQWAGDVRQEYKRRGDPYKRNP